MTRLVEVSFYTEDIRIIQNLNVEMFVSRRAKTNDHTFLLSPHTLSYYKLSCFFIFFS